MDATHVWSCVPTDSSINTHPFSPPNSRAFYDRRISQEVDGEHVGDEFKGYVFRISGGNDKQGFPMRQGVLTDQRVRLLLKRGSKCYRARRKVRRGALKLLGCLLSMDVLNRWLTPPRPIPTNPTNNPQGERKRKSVRGCIVGPDLSVLNLVVVKRGENAVPGLTDSSIPRRLGPKRASKVRKLFNLSKEDDLTKYVIARKFENKKGKTITKRPKIQRLVTPLTLQVRWVLLFICLCVCVGGQRTDDEGPGGLPPSKMMIKLVHRPVLSLVRDPGRVRGVVQTPFPPGAAALCADKNMHHYLIPLLTLAREGRTQSQVKATHAGPRPPSPPSPIPSPLTNPNMLPLLHTPRETFPLTTHTHTLQSHPQNPKPHSASARGCRPRRRPLPRPRPRPRSTSASSSSASTSAGSRAAPPSLSAAPPAAPPPRRPRSKGRAGEGRGRRRRTGAAVALGSGQARGSCWG